MGQAKNRGTFEERRAQALARERAEIQAIEDKRLAAQRAQLERMKLLPPEERRAIVMYASPAASRREVATLMALMSIPTRFR